MKKLCDFKPKEIEKKFDEFCELVARPKYVCTHCGRAASSEKRLCDPKALVKGKKKS